MKNKKGTSLLKIDNFLVETDQINSSDETFNKLMFLYSSALKQLETKMDILKEEGAFSEERKSWFPKRPDPSGYTLKKSEAAKKTPDDPADHMADDARVLIHCFSGSAELAAQYVKLGATISVAGPVTYKNNRKTVAVVAEVPMDFLLVERQTQHVAQREVHGSESRRDQGLDPGRSGGKDKRKRHAVLRDHTVERCQGIRWASDVK